MKQKRPVLGARPTDSGSYRLNKNPLSDFFDQFVWQRYSSLKFLEFQQIRLFSYSLENQWKNLKFIPSMVAT